MGWKLVGRSLVHPERHFFATMCVPESKFPETPGYVTEYVKPTTYKPTYAPTEYVKPTYKPTYAPTEYIVVAGGFQDFSVCNSVEYFSTDIGSYNSYEKPQWRELAPMNIRRFDFGLSMYGTKL